ncbi:MAG: tRNA N6-adenosine threonylcarbamoyltransferase [Candidatus Parcubacteria bacterium]|nr:tRNA N6-adenosine threonylcarbamoyltransferase [Candidatus Parcubacteria bacterium]
MILLGIETSCDETALSLLEIRGNSADPLAVKGGFECRVIVSLIHSQAELHSAYGGVYPSLAKREHGKNLIPLLHKLLIEAGMTIHPEKADAIPAFDELVEKFRTDIAPQNPELFETFSHADFLRSKPPIDGIAVTQGPGLEPALWVGIAGAQMLGELWNVPVIPVNHMEGHIVGSLLPSDVSNGTWQVLHEAPLPALAFLLSGGHTELVLMRALGEYEIIGQTKDDAVGEAFDKTARLLGLPYPGGPHLAMLAQKAKDEGIAPPVRLPRPMISSGDLDFSFSGLKTAVLYAVRDAGGTPDETWRKGLALEFEQAVTETLDAKLRKALDQTGARSLVIGGGVSANDALRNTFTATAAEYDIPLFMPSRHISGDNALMITLAGALILDRDSSQGSTQKRITPGSLRAHGTKRLGSDPIS